ncbi:SEP-domain-containing protein [Gorgonomyces haynaldii]|nr:SEP-domain-containing protein [Gorgonomyces haynaldii]
MEDKIKQFIEITKAKREEAIQFLEQSKGDVHEATTLYYQKPSFKQSNELYAGGKSSGVALQANPDDLVKDILQQAQANGERRQEPKSAFTGSGRKLGSDESPSIPVEGEDEIETVERELIFWKDGFSLGDGPLMRYDDPQNQKILEIIKSGRVPPSLLNVPLGKQVDIKVSHRVDQDYVQPKKPLQAFAGAGNRLGSVVPGEPGPSSIPGAFPSSSAASSSAPIPTVQVDNSQPVTSIQIRLADGTRLVAKFNHTHTIGDIRHYIQFARAEYRNASFVIQTPLPVKVFADDKQTLKDAGLLNAVVAQRLT